MKRMITGSMVLLSATISLWWMHHQGVDKEASIKHRLSEPSVVRIDEFAASDPDEMSVLSVLSESIPSKNLFVDSQSVNRVFSGTADQKQKVTEANNVLNQHQSNVNYDLIELSENVQDEANNVLNQHQSNFNYDLIELSENVQDKLLQNKLSDSLAAATEYREMILKKAKSQNFIEVLNILNGN